MKILHVIAGLRKAAGTSVFAGEVANELVSLGHDVAIAVANPNAVDCYPLDGRVKLVSISGVDVSKYDVVHIHALWTPILSRIADLARRKGVKVVWSPHGMLTPWALRNKWWKKLAGLLLYQWRALRHADVLHATAQSEVEDIRRMMLRNRVVVAPLGVRINERRGGRCEKLQAGKILLFVSRVQRKKGLPNLFKAWAKLRKSSPLTEGWTIRIVGPDQDNHTAELRDLVDRLGITDAVQFVGPRYGADLMREYASADLFVLPTHSENFGSVVIESLAQGVPVICTKGAPWKDLETYKCGWWCDIGVGALMVALADALAKPMAELQALGMHGFELVRSKYTWHAVATTLIGEYLSGKNCDESSS